MHVMLAESIDGGIFALLVILGELAAILLALVALIPAAHGHRLLVLLLIAPAILMVIFATCWLGQSFFSGDPEERHELASDALGMWFLFAFPPLLASVTSFSIAAYRRKRRRLPSPEADPASH